MYRNIKICSVLLLSFYLVFIPVYAHAVYDPNARNGKWYVDRLMADPTLKATVEIKAQRNYPVSTLGADGKPIIQSKVQKSTIKLAPKAANVGKSLFKRVPAIAISQALIGLGLSGVDWIMDEANNQIKWIDGAAPDPSKYWITNSGHGTSASSPQGSCTKAIASYGAAPSHSIYKGYHFKDGVHYCAVLGSGVYDNGFSIIQVPDPNYNPNSPPTQGVRSVPMPDVANELIRQAQDSFDPVAQQVLSDAALDMLEAGLLDAQLEAAAESKIFNDGESDPIDPNAPAPDPDTPTEPSPDAKPFELPPFCSWASKVCEWADWTMDDAEPPPDTPLPEKDIQMTDPSAFDKSYVSVEEECPADINASIPVGPTSFSLVIPITPICYFGSTYVSPVLQFMAYIFVALGISRSLRVG